MYFPWGWEVTVDGADVPLGRVDYLLRAVRVPAGTHDVVMTYRPESVRTTGVVSMASVIVIYIAALAALLFAIFTLPARGKDKEEV